MNTGRRGRTGKPQADEVPRVFVYGTLRVGQRYHRWIAAAVSGVVPGTAEGRLFHLPFGYPAMIWEPGAGVVHGDVLELDPRRAAQALQVMDRIEGYRGPGRANEYERIVRPVCRADGVEVLCHLYAWPERSRRWLEANGEPVPGGDWVAWLQAR
ncbi:MAG: gamma-glutamylcyclotransferase [Alicyclobacillaceae bacterium]|nr:gamma-glutamylcyclotransferase [Alicyclobacillaceae bacterium]